MQDAHKINVDTRVIEDEVRSTIENKPSHKAYQDVRQRLSNCATARDRARQALKIIEQYTRSETGYLFGLDTHGLTCLYGDGVQPAPESLVNLARAYLYAEIEESGEVSVTTADENAAGGASARFVIDDGTLFDPVILYGQKQNRLIVVGLAALSDSAAVDSDVDEQIVHAISETLLEKGDVISKYVAQ